MGGSGVRGHPWLYSKFKVSLSYLRPCLKKRTTTRNKQTKLRVLKKLIVVISVTAFTDLWEHSVVLNSPVLVVGIFNLSIQLYSVSY